MNKFYRVTEKKIRWGMVYIKPKPESRTDQNAPSADEFFSKFGRIFSKVGNDRGIPNGEPEFQHEVKDYDEFYQMALDY